MVLLASRVSLVAIPCNLLAEFAVAPATVLGFAVLALAPVAMPGAELLARVAGWPAGWIASVARTGAALPGAEADWPDGRPGALLLAALTGLLVLSARRIGRHPWLCSAAALLLVLAVLRPVPLTRVLTGWPPPGWAFAMCDVGQGDSLVLAAGPGTGVVVDAGPDPRLVDRCLRDLAITRIPLLLLTHFHADHVRGLTGVLRGRTVGVIQTTSLDEPRNSPRSSGGRPRRPASPWCAPPLVSGGGSERSHGRCCGRRAARPPPRARPPAPYRRNRTTPVSPCSYEQVGSRCYFSATSNLRLNKACCAVTPRCLGWMCSRSPTTDPRTRTRHCSAARVRGSRW